MVITHSAQADGQAQPIVIEGQDSQDTDEPPIPQAPPTRGISTKSHSTIDPYYNGRATIDCEESKDCSITSTKSWDGNASDAHAFDAKHVAAYLEVDHQYVISTKHFLTIH